MADSERFFLSRQPIVAADRRFLGWQLELAAGDGERFGDGAASSGAHLEAWKRIAGTAPWDALLCGGRALLRVDRRQIFSELFEKLPRNRLLLGLDPGIDVDANLATRLHTLHRQRGMRLLFGDYDRRDAREELLELADAVEIDCARHDAAAQELLIRRAHRRKLQVLASRVDTPADFASRAGAGFDLFLGLHYAESAGNPGSAASQEGRVLLELLLEARAGLEIDAVTSRLTARPGLEEGLLRLVNGLELARAQKIESVEQALIMIGVDGLSRWLNLLLFKVGGVDADRSPLFRVAASRARLMELVASGGATEDPALKERGETAFLVGMLSLVHVLLGVTRSEAVAGLPLPESIRAAFDGGGDELGLLLRLTESLDSGAFAEVAAVASELGLDTQRVWEHQREAWEWVARIA